MTKKKTEKSLSEATITTKSVSTKKKSVKKKAKVTGNGMVEVVVKSAKFGTYKKGDVVQMNVTTAEACVKNGAVTYK
jgi:hypothetical protein